MDGSKVFGTSPPEDSRSKETNSANNHPVNGLSESIIHDSGLYMPALADTATQHQDTHHSISGDIPKFADVKKILASLIDQNAQLRLGHGQTEVESLSDGFHGSLQGILSDEICDTFSEYMRGIGRQTKTLLSRGVDGPLASPVIRDTDNIPLAPRAMLVSERVRVLEDMLRQNKALNSAERENLPPPGLHTLLPAAPISIPLPPTTNPASTLDTSRTSTTTPASAHPSAEGIAIPLDPQFLSPPKRREHEEGEITSSSITPVPAKRLSVDSMRGIRATNERNRPRRSASPEPPRHRLPPSRTYRFSGSPEDKRRRRSPSRRSPRPLRRSPSPNYRRTYSPDHRYYRRSPSNEVDWRYRRVQASPTTRSSRPLNPKSVPSTSRRRCSEHDAGLSKPNRYEPSRASTLPDLRSPNGTHKTYYPQRPDHERNVSVETTSSDYRRSNHERRHGFERASNEESESFRQLPKQSLSPVNKEVSHRTDGRDGNMWYERERERRPTPTRDIAMKERSSTPMSDVSMRERTPTTAQLVKEQVHSPSKRPTTPPVLFQGESTGEQSSHKPGSPLQISEMLCHNVPGLWMVKSGLETVEILTCEFEIDKNIAERWGIRCPSKHGKEKENDSLSIKLACVQPGEIEAVQTKLGVSGASSEDIVSAVAQIETIWPPAGHLVIEVNPDRDWGQSWLPRHLEDDQGAIEMIDHVHEGKNVIRFIQLAGLNNFTFLIIARPRPPDIYCLEPAPAGVDGREGEVENFWTGDQLLKDFLTDIQITYS